MRFINILLVAISIIIYNPLYIYAHSLRIIKSSSGTGLLNSKIIFLADQLENNISEAYKSWPIVVTTFVDINRLDETNTFGRAIAESLIHELQVRGWNVLEIRLSRSIFVNDKGEFALTRDRNKLKSSKVKVRLLVLGTYFITGNNVVINARIVDFLTGQVLSTAQAAVPINGLEGILTPSLIPSIRIE